MELKEGVSIIKTEELDELKAIATLFKLGEGLFVKSEIDGVMYIAAKDSKDSKLVKRIAKAQKAIEKELSPLQAAYERLNDKFKNDVEVFNKSISQLGTRNKELYSANEVLVKKLEKAEKSVICKEEKIKELHRKLNDCGIEGSKYRADISALNREVSAFRNETFQREQRIESLGMEACKYKSIVDTLCYVLKGKTKRKVIEVIEKSKKAIEECK